MDKFHHVPHENQWPSKWGNSTFLKHTPNFFICSWLVIIPQIWFILIPWKPQVRSGWHHKPPKQNTPHLPPWRVPRSTKSKQVKWGPYPPSCGHLNGETRSLTIKFRGSRVACFKQTQLVGGWPTPLKNMSSSVGKIKFMFQTTNQPDMILSYCPFSVLFVSNISKNRDNPRPDWELLGSISLSVAGADVLGGSDKSWPSQPPWQLSLPHGMCIPSEPNKMTSKGQNTTQLCFFILFKSCKPTKASTWNPQVEGPFCAVVKSTEPRPGSFKM